MTTETTAAAETPASAAFIQSSAGPSANPSKVVTPPGSPCGAGGGGAD